MRISVVCLTAILYRMQGRFLWLADNILLQTCGPGTKLETRQSPITHTYTHKYIYVTVCDVMCIHCFFSSCHVVSKSRRSTRCTCASPPPTGRFFYRPSSVSTAWGSPNSRGGQNAGATTRKQPKDSFESPPFSSCAGRIRRR